MVVDRSARASIATAAAHWPLASLPPWATPSRPSKFAAWFALLAGSAVFFAIGALEDDRVAAIAAGCVFLLCVWLLLRVLRLRLLSPVMLYLCIFGLFHLGLVVPWALDIASRSPPYWVLRYPLWPAMSLIVLGLTAYLTGAVAGAARWAERKQPQSSLQQNTPLYQCGLAVCAGGLLLFAWGIHLLGFSRFLEASYIDTFELVRLYDPRFFITSLTVVPVGLCISAAAAPRRSYTLLLCLSFFWMLLIAFIGYRAHALVPMVIVVAVLSKRGLRIPRLAYGAALAALLVAVPAARSMRESRLSERSLGGVLSGVRPLSAIEEMGGSLQPLVHTIQLMETEPLRRGMTYWNALLRVLPNLSSRWRSGGYVRIENLSPTHWVTIRAEPWKYKHHGGIGFSAVAEPYMNFSHAGVAGYFFLLGLFLVWLDRVDGFRPTRLAAWAILLGPLLLTTRGSFDSFFRPAVWGLLILIASRIVCDSLASRAGGATAALPQPGRAPVPLAEAPRA